MPLRVALIGQSAFGQAVYQRLRTDGHTIVGVFTIPDKNGRADMLATAAEADGVPVFKFARWQVKGVVVPEVFEQYCAVNAELNVLAFVSQFIPLAVIEHPKHTSICYHPSILPRHRGASAINWTLMQGDAEAGFTVFWPDDGLDTGAILLQRSCAVTEDDTLSSLYERFLFPEGVDGMAEAVRMIDENRAPRITQSSEGATYDAIWQKKELACIQWNQPARVIHNFIRGNDKVPGAWCTLDDLQVTLYGSSLLHQSLNVASASTSTSTSISTVTVRDCEHPAYLGLHPDGLVFTGSDGAQLLVRRLKIESTGKILNANDFLKTINGDSSSSSSLLEQLSDTERTMVESAKSIWASILGLEITNDTDFFGSGAGSMDVTRMVETIQQKIGVSIEIEQVYMNTSFADFASLLVQCSRKSGGDSTNVSFRAFEIDANDLHLRIPTQLFINGEFVEPKRGEYRATMNPTTEEHLCDVAQASEEDVQLAVAAAKSAFESAEWSRMNARDRGRLLYRLADLMEEHKEELATIESLDSGAVYTLALKTHVGMSIDTFRYYAGWCDKLTGHTIPINHAKPNYNLCLTKREPVGVVGLVIPWNYPLMMLSWKMGACLAAGNTVVIKPANVTPLTALKWAELTVRAGFPRGVINVLTGSGALVGNALASHPDVRKLGFTGSTGVGKQIMEAAAVSNLKRVSLELGGKSPLIVFADCELDRAVRQTLSSAFFNKGENCIAAGRIFVERAIHDEFLARLVAETKKLTIGDPLDRATSHGPQNHRAHLDKLIEYIERGVSEGATLVHGGKRLPRKGFFLEPTIFTNVTDEMYIAREESFGPVLIVMPFDGSVDDVLRRANRCEYALASGVFTRDINKALRVSDGLHAGTVFVNCYNKTDVAAPFGGFKQSGFGKDLGEEALYEYTQVKTITIEYS